ncbi:hypothetical protein DFH05DRAFT_1252352 [Lentinula detonsa]|uniref:Heme-binding protein n=1 Tax=Lentinula detonsa TaxID=2804962 RepID=A0A9W8NZM3_9AGAR|nr:hypothetical protein DFH05DRAFT_1252352 [Lentinula detonsa]
MHLRLGLWITALILGLIHPILGIPTGRGSVMRIEQDPNSPGKISNADHYIKKVYVQFKPDDSPVGRHSVEPLDLGKPTVRAAEMMVEFVLRSAWKELEIEPSVRWSTREAYGVKFPEISIDKYGSLAAGWTPAKQLNFSLIRSKAPGVQREIEQERAYVKPIPTRKKEGSFRIYVKGLVEKTVKMDSETLKELRQLVPFEWPKDLFSQTWRRGKHSDGISIVIWNQREVL